MRIAITGGTGFIGRHLARALSAAGHEAVLVARGADRRETELLTQPGISFRASDLSDPAILTAAFEGVGAIAHCAGINREIGRQTYQRVHVDGTANVIHAAHAAGVPRIAMVSFLRARPGCGMPYHESKWAAEEMVRGSGLDYTILKCGMTYGRGDHMLDHITRMLATLPIFATVGFRAQAIRPVAVEDVTAVLMAALTGGRLSRSTVFVLGPETLMLRDALERVASAIGRRVWTFPAPVRFHRGLAWVLERTMRVPLVASAQVRMLAEGFLDPEPFADSLPDDLLPRRAFTPEQIRRGVPPLEPFGPSDLRCCLS